MSKETFLLVIGLVVFATPLLGVPLSWKAIILFVSGASIVFIASVYWMQKRRHARPHADMLHAETLHDGVAHV